MGQASPLAFPGSIVAGKYRLDRPIGAGGMGSVWAATHVALGQTLAIKLVSPDLVKSPEAVRRFDVEAKAAVQIKSRHVPQVFDNGLLEDGTPFIAMELLEGESLVKRIARSGALPLGETVSIVAQCCRGLARAHALGIVHRDIKPDNIFLANLSDEDGYLVKILDFGVAKISLALEGGSSATRTGTLIGTPAYMSPEQARALSTVDHRTDLFSLGLVTYCTLTGRQAFNAESLGDLLLQICAQPLPSLVAARPDLPDTLDAWFQRACAREPAHRYQTAQELGEALSLAAGLSDGTARGSRPLVAFNTPPGEGLGPTLKLPPAAPSGSSLRPSTTAGASVTGIGERRIGVGWVVGIAAAGVIAIATGSAVLLRGSPATKGPGPGLVSSPPPPPPKEPPPTLEEPPPPSIVPTSSSMATTPPRAASSSSVAPPVPPSHTTKAPPSHPPPKTTSAPPPTPPSDGTNAVGY